jgi:hypothetical protein
MTRSPRLRSLALACLSVLGLAVPGVAQAQQPAREMVPFKVASKVKVDPAATYVIPLEPTLLSVKLTGGGEAPPLGAFTTIESPQIRQGVDGKDLWTEALGVFSGTNGDAVFYQYKGIVPRMEATFVITGGKGRFLGATGSGVMTWVATANQGEFICTFDGTISAPK